MAQLGQRDGAGWKATIAGILWRGRPFGGDAWIFVIPLHGRAHAVKHAKVEQKAEVPRFPQPNAEDFQRTWKRTAVQQGPAESEKCKSTDPFFPVRILFYFLDLAPPACPKGGTAQKSCHDRLEELAVWFGSRTLTRSGN